VAGYYIDWLREAGGTFRKMRIDAGSENVVIERMHLALHLQDTYTTRHVIIGKSTSNQRIERFWGSLRRGLLQFYMDLFGNLLERGHLDLNNEYQKDCLVFCFFDLIKHELEDYVTMHNTSRCKTKKGTGTPSGKPDILYNSPQAFGGEARYNYTLPNDLIDGLEDYAAREDAHGLSPETHDVFKRLTRVHGMHYPPADADDATQLFKKLSVLTV